MQEQPTIKQVSLVICTCGKTHTVPTTITVFPPAPSTDIEIIAQTKRFIEDMAYNIGMLDISRKTRPNIEQELTPLTSMVPVLQYMLDEHNYTGLRIVMDGLDCLEANIASMFHWDD